MTDNQIIKGLERTASWECDVCTFRGEMCDGEQCEKVVAENALDLINRQKAEIERLLKIISDKEDSCIGLATQLKITNELLKTAKSEAINEFAENAKKECYATYDEVLPSLFADIIDNLAKEMTEVSE